MDVTKFRIYADESVVHEDDFEEMDNSQPFLDDYKEYIVPQSIIDFLYEYFK